MSSYVKEQAMNVLNSLDEEQTLDFLRLFADDNTLAIIESEMIAQNPYGRKQYRNFKELLAEVEEEMANEGNE